MNWFLDWWCKRWQWRAFLARRDEEGQGLVEYGLILGLIAVIGIAALTQQSRPASVASPSAATEAPVQR